MHGDLHADNVVIDRNGQAVILDFDVVRRERDGGLCDLGVLLHRALRVLSKSVPDDMLEATCRLAATQFLGAYSRVRSVTVTSSACFEAALSESSRKHEACKLGLVGSSQETRDVFADNHMRYMQELRLLVQVVDESSIANRRMQ